MFTISVDNVFKLLTFGISGKFQGLVSIKKGKCVSNTKSMVGLPKLNPELSHHPAWYRMHHASWRWGGCSSGVDRPYWLGETRVFIFPQGLSVIVIFSKGLSVILIFFRKGSPSSWFFSKRALRHRDFCQKGSPLAGFFSKMALRHRNLF